MNAIMQKNGFAFRKVTPIAEMKGKLWEMEHTQSGAKLVWLERADENMTFAIGFKTIPTDSTGVFHILEHSVLCGSDKYPVKEPFVELLKSSLQTFLNAMTYPDKTVYPVSSRNKQDFMNLMSIYMDAVLHPAAAHDSKIFRQEGWRFELGEDGKPMYQGVVYNEMKGAFSDVRSVLEYEMMKALFPDNCYRHESGGDPDCIPDLTYEQFVASHAKYYHPSNALIVLDGAVDLEECLGFLNGCLAPYSRQEMEFPIEMQEAKPFRALRAAYEIGAGEDAAERTILSWGKLACTFRDTELLYGLPILSDYLCGGSEGPLKKAVLDAGLGADVSVDLHDGMQQAWLGWQVWNTDEEKIPAVRQTVRDTLEKLVREGLDKDRLEACWSTMAFRLQNRDGMGFPRGVMEALTVLEPWLYGGDPCQNLSFNTVMTSLREKIATGWFESLIRTYLLDETDGVLLTLVPSKELGQARLERESGKLAAAWDALNEGEKANAAALCEAVRTWQQTPDSPEALATIPLLKLEDIAGYPKEPVMAVEAVEGTPVLRHSVDSGLAYINLYFDASDLTAEELPLLTLLGSLLGKLAAGEHTGARLQTLVKQKLGSLRFSADVYGQGVDSHKAYFALRAELLRENLEEASSLIQTVLTATRYEDTKLVGDILRQNKNDNQMRLISGGNRYAASRVAARETSAGAAREYLMGCSYMSWVNARCTQADYAQVLDALGALAAKLFTRSRATVSVSENAAGQAQALVLSLPAGEGAVGSGSVALLDACREGIVIPAGVAYAAKGANTGRTCGQNYVLSNLLSYAHLWNEVRVQGGAYGAGFYTGDNGDVTYYSYRDPNPGRSIGCFDASADFIESFSRSGEKLDKFILGAMSEADPLLGANGRMQLAERRYFKGTTYADACKRLDELRGTTWEDLLELAQLLRQAASKDNQCVVGGQDLLDGCGDKLETVIQILS